MSVTFPTFHRWAAVNLDGDVLGYMEHFNDATRLHLKKDAPDWLKAVRSAGPFDSLDSCKRAVAFALPPHDTPGIFGPMLSFTGQDNAPNAGAYKQ